VHTLAVPIVSDMSEMYKGLDCGALTCVLGKLGVEKSYGSRLDDTRQALQHKTVSLLKEFRMMHAQHFRAPNKMMLPDPARMLPLYTLALTKVAAMRGTARDVNADERIAVGFEMMAASPELMARLIYPDLYPVFEMNGEWGTEKDGRVVVPGTVALSMEQLNGGGAYLMDNGRLFILWLGRNIPPGYVGELFAADPATLPPDLTGLSVEPERPTNVSKRLNALMRQLRKRNSGIYQQCFVVRQVCTPSDLPYRHIVAVVHCGAILNVLLCRLEGVLYGGARHPLLCGGPGPWHAELHGLFVYHPQGCDFEALSHP
jgi:protein transport protein SEC24